MKREATYLERALQQTEAELQALMNELDRPIMDGTPFYLCVRKNGTVAEESVQVYGDWPTPNGKVRGWVHLCSQPSHLCGARMNDSKSWEANLDLLRTVAPEKDFFLLHRQGFLRKRIAAGHELCVQLRLLVSREARQGGDGTL